MSNAIEELTAKFRQTCAESGENEQRVIERMTQRLHISRNVNREYEETLTLGQRLADRLAIFGGSWTFILLFLSLLLLWIVLNTVVLARLSKSFDPYPYIFLNLILSMLAALQAPVIMMSQNRYAAKDRVAAEHDYEVNLKAELEILALHQKVDTLREQQWMELVAMQQEQIRLLTKLLAHFPRVPIRISRHFFSASRCDSAAVACGRDGEELEDLALDCSQCADQHLIVFSVAG
jgi:uncharacterized membrane protein